MKVRVLKLFQDKYTKEWYKPNQEIEISKERFNEILKVDKLVEEVKEEKKLSFVIAEKLDDEHITPLENTEELDKLGEAILKHVKPKKEAKKKKK